MGTERTILVVGGTGMLRHGVHDLLAEGATVVLVARRPERVGEHPRLVPVRADWNDPDDFATSLQGALGSVRPAEAVLWVHSQFGEKVHAALDPLLDPNAVVVHLWGSAVSDPRQVPVPPEYAPPRSYRQVVLGYTGAAGRTRWLTNREISDGALRALRDPSSQQIVGRVEPWEHHP